VAELSEGFGGKLANQEITFMVLEGAMIVIACISLTVAHPGVAFHGRWKDATLSSRIGEKTKTDIGEGIGMNRDGKAHLTILRKMRSIHAR